ncbi:uncharacterized protein METZ01_LOCUS322333, partial [marine metagenome]
MPFRARGYLKQTVSSLPVTSLEFIL